MYILVAEDDEFYAKIYQTKLAKEGYEVTVVGDGAQALEQIHQRKPDLVLLDLVMPVKDGFDVLAEIKANPQLADIKVLVLSSLSQEEDAKKAKEMGAYEYIVKTDISIYEMIAKIKTLLGSN